MSVIRCVIFAMRVMHFMLRNRNRTKGVKLHRLHLKMESFFDLIHYLFVSNIHCKYSIARTLSLGLRGPSLGPWVHMHRRSVSMRVPQVHLGFLVIWFFVYLFICFFGSGSMVISRKVRTVESIFGSVCKYL